jgi:luciferase family oxidoreductase group 1
VYPLSILDLSPIPQGSTASQALWNTRDLAQHAERWGYGRYWLAEHHNMTGIASAATSVVIGYVAAATSTIRVGSGGVMLPNHSPLVIAEQFGTLASMYPGRIDLGLGRAPGTDQRTAMALRRDPRAGEDFPQDVLELHGYFQPAQPGQAIRAVPGAGLEVPIWLLGSSLYSAQLAAMLGMPFAFASHFAPDMIHQALSIYRSTFKPSDSLAKPYAMIGVNICAADTEEEAHFLFTSRQQQSANLRRGTPGQLPPPRADMDAFWSPAERAGIERSLVCSAVGDPAGMRDQLNRLIAATGADEMMLTGQIFEHKARLRAFEIVSEIRKDLVAAG